MDLSTSKKSEVNAADKLFSETLWRCMRGFALIFSFRRIASIGVQSSFNQILHDSHLLMHNLFYNPDYKGILVPLNPDSTRVPNLSNLANHLAQSQVGDFSLAVDAASLVFAHSVLDDAALQYCRVTAIVSPNSWEKFVIDKKIKLEEVRDDNYQRLLRQKATDYVNQLDRESLLTKHDRLFQVCQPPPNFISVKGFTFDRSRLEGLDTIRHTIIHETGPVHRLPNGDEDLRFMQNCSFHLMSMVNAKFGTRFDERAIDLHSAETGGKAP